MHDTNAFERQVARDALRDAGPSRPVDAAAVFARAVPASPISGWRFQSMFNAVKLFAVGATLALLGGVLLTGFLAQPTDDSAPAAPSATLATEAVTTEPSIESSTDDVTEAGVRPIALPATIPDGVESGSFETPLGPARWVHLRGTTEEMPYGLDPIAVPDGFLTLDGGGRLWSSPDLIEWSRLDGPAGSTAGEPMSQLVEMGEYLQLVEMGEYLWLLSAPPEDGEMSQRLWRSMDARTWHEVDIAPLLPSSPPGVTWRLSLEPETVTFGDMVIVQTRATPNERPTKRLGVNKPGGVGVRRTEAGVYRIMNAGRERQVVEPSADGLRVLAADGTQIAEVDGWSMEFVDWMARGFYGHDATYRQPGLAVLRDGEFVPIDLPGERPNGSILVRSMEDGLWATLKELSGMTASWTSADGLTWSQSPEVRDISQPPEDARFTAMESGKAPDTWAPLGSGWLTIRDGKVRFEAEGSAPTRVANGDVPKRLVAGNLDSLGRLSDSTAAFWQDHHPEDGQNHLWILTLDER